MHDPSVTMYHRTEIAKFLMQNQREPRPQELNIKIIIQGIDPQVTHVERVSVGQDLVPKLPLLN
jgi:hypothetical protein